MFRLFLSAWVLISMDYFIFLLSMCIHQGWPGVCGKSGPSLVSIVHIRRLKLGKCLFQYDCRLILIEQPLSEIVTSISNAVLGSGVTYHSRSSEPPLIVIEKLLVILAYAIVAEPPCQMNWQEEKGEALDQNALHTHCCCPDFSNLKIIKTSQIVECLLSIFRV